MNFKKVNNITGWVVFFIASLTYILTAEKSGSLWDCGEFVAACYKVQMPHPPGAPLFVLLGRFFIILFGDDGATAARAVNIMNAVGSAATVLFLFWTITHFARKLTVGFREEPTGGQIFTIMGAGAVGALAYTFTDSFWYSAVEGEVYALSSLFTAIAFWAMLKWERADDAAGNSVTGKARADRWIVFLFFSLGLSIGIHLLGLLVIPAAVMIYYYKRYNYTQKGAIFAFIIGCLITGIVQVVVIQWSVKLAGSFDVFFVNSFGLPFFAGFIFFFLLLAVLVWVGLRVAAKNNWSLLRLGLWCFTFMMLGYSAYITTMERSNANPAIDMNNVDNPMSLVYYLGREQYGSQPIVTGPHFLAQPVDSKEGKMRFAKDDSTGQYLETGRDREPVYDPKDVQVFPRIWDGSDEQQHATYYMQWLQLPIIAARSISQVTGVGDGIVQVVDQNGKQDTYSLEDNFAPRVQRGQVVQPGQPIAVKIPSFADNLEWFFTYQMGFMYWRYFMWNFSGKQNDIQGGGNIRDGNWITGIAPLDNMRLGDQGQLPSSIQNNKANNKLFLLPFLLGVVGCIFQFLRDRKDWIASFLLFFFTGIAIVLYLNQPGNQPRERDYAFAGSYYAFAIWIGLAVVAFVRMAREVQEKSLLTNVLVYGGATTFLIMFLADLNHMNSGAAMAAVGGAVLFVAVTLAITFLTRAVGKANLKTAALVATAASLITPAVMASQEWDDHDRSEKLLAPDLARDYLNSCPQNAILFTFGDNDTYPLWYAQEVEGVRPDIRILNTSLLGIDWYVNQLRYKVNESPAIPLVWSASQIRGLQYIMHQPVGDQEGFYDLQDLLQNIGSRQTPIATFPVRKFSLPVSGAASDSAGGAIRLDLSDKSYLTLDQLTILNVLAANNWKRPICFTSPYGELGFSQYLRQQGLVYLLTPVQQPGARSMDVNRTDSLLRNVFRFGNANQRGVYFDEENRRHLLTIRQVYADAALNLAEQGRKQEAVTLLEKADKGILEENLPYAMVSRFQMHNRTGLAMFEAALRAGHTPMANKIKAALRKDLQEQKKYYDYLKNEKPNFYPSFEQDEEFANQVLGYMDNLEKMNQPLVVPKENVQGAAADSGRQP